jgi:hypothetical protein
MITIYGCSTRLGMPLPPAYHRGQRCCQWSANGPHQRTTALASWPAGARNTENGWTTTKPNTLATVCDAIRDGGTSLLAGTLGRAQDRQMQWMSRQRQQSSAR